MEFTSLPPELQEIIISHSNTKWRLVNKHYKLTVDRYLLRYTGFLSSKRERKFISRLAEKSYIGPLEVYVIYSKNKIISWEIVYYLCKYNHVKLLGILLEYTDIDWNDQISNLVTNIIFFNRSQMMRVLLQKGKLDPSINNNSIIHYAASRGYIDIVKILLADPRVDPSDRNNRAIISASERGHTEVVKLLLNDTRVNVSDNNNEAIILASKYHHDDIVKIVLDHIRLDITEVEYRELVKTITNHISLRNILMNGLVISY